jgi:hypothetical protein
MSQREQNVAIIENIVGVLGSQASFIMDGRTGSIAFTADGGFTVNGNPVSTLVYRGLWSNTTAYVVGNLVTASNGDIYVAIASGTNHNPISSPTFWTPLLAAGSLVPAGGTTGQGLVKVSNTDGDTTWGTSILAAIANQEVLGNISGGPLAPVGLTQAQLRTLLGLAAIAISGSGSDLSAATVALTKLAVEADQTILGNIAGAGVSPVALTAAQATALLNAFVASGAGHLKGLVPDPGVGAGTTKFLREDASWQVPGGGGGLSPVIGSVNTSLTGTPTAMVTAPVLANIGYLFSAQIELGPVANTSVVSVRLNASGGAALEINAIIQGAYRLDAVPTTGVVYGGSGATNAIVFTSTGGSNNGSIHIHGAAREIGGSNGFLTLEVSVTISTGTVRRSEIVLINCG